MATIMATSGQKIGHLADAKKPPESLRFQGLRDGAAYENRTRDLFITSEKAVPWKWPQNRENTPLRYATDSHIA